MFINVDLYLGVFLILCGFGISLLNLTNIISSNYGVKMWYILLSENVLLMCIGIAFLCRAIYFLNPENLTMENVELKMAASKLNEPNFQCGFSTLILSYGPFVVSIVNSFLSLIIDNYLHYKMLRDIKKKEQEDMVREIGETSRSLKVELGKLYKIGKEYFSYLTIILQWIIPIIITLFMYPMDVKEMSMQEMRSLDDLCMATINMGSSNCNNYTDFNNITEELRTNLIFPENYIETIEGVHHNENTSSQIDLVLSNVLKILKNFNNNHTDFQYTNLKKSWRQPKFNDDCIKMCFTDNKDILVYMFALAVIGYFIPITISTIILTKIHIMDVKRPNAKTFVTRELLYNVLFWTPVMFDTFLSLVMCSFTMHGMRTSLLNVVANVYQAVRNFMQTRYFKENTVLPV